MKRLGKQFYARDALTVARDLIGCLFVHDHAEARAGVRIVETEAYRGGLDPGSHGYKGPTPRTASMFGPPGRLYVYFTYGIHWCVNVVCGQQGDSEAVLLRAGDPVIGRDVMRARRPAVTDDRLLAAGPARLAQAMAIGKQHDGASLLRGGSFWCAEDAVTHQYRSRISQTTRIGLAEGRGDDLPWRFVVAGHASVSRRR